MRRSLAAFKLPPGRHGLAREHVRASQRWRLLGAIGDLFAEDGYANLSAHRVAREAAVSSQTFYAHFRNVDDCLLAAFEIAADRIQAAAAEGCAARNEQAGRLGRSIAAILGLSVQDPALARLLGLEARAAVPAIAEGFTRLVDCLAIQLQGVRSEGRGPSGQASIEARILVRAGLALLAEASFLELEPLLELADQLQVLLAMQP